MKASVLRKHGYKPIVSEAEATNLLRRELKQIKQNTQRNPNFPRHAAVFDRLLSIRPGAWYKFYKLLRGQTILLIWASAEDDESCSVQS